MDDGNPENYVGLRERIASNNILWVVFLFIIVGVTGIVIARSIGTQEKATTQKLVEDPIGVYTDSMHEEFADQLVKMAGRRGVKIEASFVSDRTFKIIMPCDIGGDELSFLSRYAATGIWRKFKVNPTIWTYTEDVSSPAPKLSARTAWSAERRGFVVTFERPMGAD